MPPAEPDALIGATLIDKYKIVRQIGRGGMGVVYEAEHLGLGKRVAIKLMLEKYAEDRDAVSRFKREALAASRIGNPHIIDISDIGVAADGRSFVVMELLQGTSLAEVIRREGALPPARAVEIMRQTLRAVGAAHGKGIIHRDLKPDNIFLLDQDDGRDFVKLLDFGISKAVDQAAEIAKTKLTTTGMVMGTPLYMAPEQAMGEQADARADIYALGVILYEMLAGTPPFVGVTLAVLLAKLLTEQPALLSDVAPGLPPPLVAAVHRALEKDPATRFASCDAFVAAISGERAITGQRAARVTADVALDQTAAVPVLAIGTDVQRARRLSEQPTDLQTPAPTAAATSTAPNPAMTAVAITAKDPPRRSGAMPLVLAGLGGAVIVGAVVIGLQLMQHAPAAVPAAPPPPVLVAAPPAPAPAPIAVVTPITPDAAVMEPAQAPAQPGPAQPPVKPAPPVKRVGGAPAPAPAPAPGPDPVAAKPAHATTTRDDVAAAIRRHDGKGCRAALAGLTELPTDYRVASLHAVCEMVNGNCDVGLKEQIAVNARDGSPNEAGAKVIVDLYCPPSATADPAERLHRLAKQVSMFPQDCVYYLGPTRAAAKIATSDADRHTVGVLLADMATCFSNDDKCDKARQILNEAKVFIPALALNELNPACR